MFNKHLTRGDDADGNPIGPWRLDDDSCVTIYPTAARFGQMAPLAMTLAHATGPQLNTFGTSVGLPPLGNENDDEYRVRLKECVHWLPVAMLQQKMGGDAGSGMAREYAQGYATRAAVFFASGVRLKVSKVPLYNAPRNAGARGSFPTEMTHALRYKRRVTACLFA